MDWTRQLDGYCERMGPGYWAEPVNAVTNAAFVIAALWLWPRTRGVERVLAAILFAIGIGSYLFHTHATVWAAVSDTTPIALFILVYVYAANRHYWRFGTIWSVVGAALFIPYAMGTGAVFDALPFFTISSYYWPVALLIAIYAVLLRDRLPRVARGLAIGAAILTVSLTFRSLDMPFCDALPLGTHFMWHILNGVMLGWMIWVLRRHRLEGAEARA